MVVKWLRTILSTSKKIVGQDYLGNTYFETAKSKLKKRMLHKRECIKLSSLNSLLLLYTFLKKA